MVAEIIQPVQVRALAQAFDQYILKRETLTNIAALTHFADLTRIMGKGEAASLAAAATFGWSIACDERRVFLREARKHLGEGRILRLIPLSQVRLYVVGLAWARGPNRPVAFQLLFFVDAVAV